MATAEQRNQIIDYAKTLVGTPYKELDCNEFVRKVFRKFGAELGDPSSGNAKSLYKKGLAKKVDKDLSISAIAKLLNKGDCVFWASKNHPERWMNIHHVSIYDEDEYNFESSSDRGKVVRRKLWENSTWQIVLIADITSLLKFKDGGDTEMFIKKGDKDARVLEYQTDLVYLGFSVGTKDGKPDLDSDFGSKTLEGHNAFQKAHELKETQDVNEETQLALFKALREKAQAADGNYAAYTQRVSNYASGVKTAANMKI
jgi:hypothetical protein